MKLGMRNSLSVERSESNATVIPPYSQLDEKILGSASIITIGL